MDRAMDAGPQVSLLALGRWLVALQEPSESVVDGLVVDKDVDWAFRRGNEVNEGQSLSPLGGLGKAVDLGTVVEAVASVVEDAESRPGEERVRLVGAGAVGGGVDPVGPVRVQVRAPFIVPSVRRWARDGLGHGVVGKLGLEVQEDGVFFEEATVPGVRRETVPLRCRNEDIEGLRCGAQHGQNHTMCSWVSSASSQ